MSCPLILLSSMLVSLLMITMQYSGGQNIVPISRETQVTPDEEPDVQGGPEAPEKEPQAPDKEPEAQVEEPKEQKEEPSGADEGEPEVKGEDKSEEQSTDTTTPGKGTLGGLDIANTTQQTFTTRIQNQDNF
jgi:outer membrane biosynthesis protein TonB